MAEILSPPFSEDHPHLEGFKDEAQPFVLLAEAPPRIGDADLKLVPLAVFKAFAEIPEGLVLEGGEEFLVSSVFYVEDFIEKIFHGEGLIEGFLCEADGCAFPAGGTEDVAEGPPGGVVVLGHLLQDPLFVSEDPEEEQAGEKNG